LATLLAGLPPRRDRGRPRLPIDRIFTLSGFGTVVTGTLLDGEFAVGDAVEILPARHAARIRSLQTHHRQVATGRPGSRLAINLAGVSTDDLRRGDVVARPDTLTPTLLFDARFRLLADAPRPLKHNQARRPLRGRGRASRGGACAGRRNHRAGRGGLAATASGARCRCCSRRPFHLAPAQPQPDAWRRRGAQPGAAAPLAALRPQVLARLATLAHGQPDEVLLHTLDRLRLTTPRQLIAGAELDAAVAAAALDDLRRQHALVEIARRRRAADEPCNAWRAYRRSVAGARGGLSPPVSRCDAACRAARRAAGSSRCCPASIFTVRIFNAVLDELGRRERICAPTTRVCGCPISPPRRRLRSRRIDRLLAAFAAAPYAPPNQQDALQLLGGDAELLEFLVEQGVLVRLGGDVLLRSADFAKRWSMASLLTCGRTARSRWPKCATGSRPAANTPRPCLKRWMPGASRGARAMRGCCADDRTQVSITG
jgi:selenocysteine-specific elongation factor